MSRFQEILLILALVVAAVIGYALAQTGRYQAVVIETPSGATIVCCIIDTWTGHVTDPDLYAQETAEK